jgi:hypothetical protein
MKWPSGCSFEPRPMFPRRYDGRTALRRRRPSATYSRRWMKVGVTACWVGFVLLGLSVLVAGQGLGTIIFSLGISGVSAVAAWRSSRMATVLVYSDGRARHHQTVIICTRGTVRTTRSRTSEVCSSSPRSLFSGWAACRASTNLCCGLRRGPRDDGLGRRHVADSSI